MTKILTVLEIDAEGEFCGSNCARKVFGHCSVYSVSLDRVNERFVRSDFCTDAEDAFESMRQIVKHHI